MKKRREMALWDWANAGFLLLIGLLLGVALDSVIDLVAMGYWIMAVILVLAFLAVFVFELLMDKVFDKFFHIGVKRVSEPDEQKYKPLIVLLSFPTGMLLGVLLAGTGWDHAVLSLF